MASNAFNGGSLLPLGGGYRSANKLTGDFDLTVDYQLLTWPSQSGVRVGLLVGTQEELLLTGGTNINMGWTTARTSLGNASTDFPSITGADRENYVTDFGGTVSGPAATTDLSGSLRLRRTGGEIFGYYFGVSDWVLISQASILSDDLYLGLAAWSHDLVFTDKDVKVAFDNICGISPPGVPVPGPEAFWLYLVGGIAAFTTHMGRRVRRNPLCHKYSEGCNPHLSAGKITLLKP